LILEVDKKDQVQDHETVKVVSAISGPKKAQTNYHIHLIS